MGKEVVNRRENLLASDIPPEIPDVSTFVQKTDKASASKLGLVKIGDNVSISSAGAISVPIGSSETAGVYKVGEGLSVADGVLSAGASGGMTELYTMPEEEAEQTAFNSAVTLNATSVGYKALFILCKRGDYIVPHFISNVQNGHNVCSTIGNPSSPGFSMRDFKPNGTTIAFNSGGDANAKWYAVYGVN